MSALEASSFALSAFTGKSVVAKSCEEFLAVASQSGLVADQKKVEEAIKTITSFNSDLNKLNEFVRAFVYVIDSKLSGADFVLFGLLCAAQDDLKKTTSLLRYVLHILSLLPSSPAKEELSKHFNTQKFQYLPTNILSIEFLDEKTEKKQQQSQKQPQQVPPVVEKKQDNKAEKQATKPAKDEKKSAAAKPAKEEKKQEVAASKLQSVRLDIRSGVIISVEEHPSEEHKAKLYALQVQVGQEKTKENIIPVVSGLRPMFPEPASLLSKKVLLIVNLKAGDIHGVQSAGRILVATSKDGSTKQLLQPANEKLGQKYYFAAFPADAKPQPQTAPDACVAAKHWHTCSKELMVAEGKENKHAVIASTSAVPTASSLFLQNDEAQIVTLDCDFLQGGVVA